MTQATEATDTQWRLSQRPRPSGDACRLPLREGGFLEPAHVGGNSSQVSVLAPISKSGRTNNRASKGGSTHSSSRPRAALLLRSNRDAPLPSRYRLIEEIPDCSTEWPDQDEGRPPTVSPSVVARILMMQKPSVTAGTSMMAPRAVSDGDIARSPTNGATSRPPLAPREEEPANIGKWYHRERNASGSRRSGRVCGDCLDASCNLPPAFSRPRAARVIWMHRRHPTLFSSVRLARAPLIPRADASFPRSDQRACRRHRCMGADVGSARHETRQDCVPAFLP